VSTEIRKGDEIQDYLTEAGYENCTLPGSISQSVCYYVILRYTDERPGITLTYSWANEGESLPSTCTSNTNYSETPEAGCERAIETGYEGVFLIKLKEPKRGQNLWVKASDSCGNAKYELIQIDWNQVPVNADCGCRKTGIPETTPLRIEIRWRVTDLQNANDSAIFKMNFIQLYDKWTETPTSTLRHYLPKDRGRTYQGLNTNAEGPYAQDFVINLPVEAFYFADSNQNNLYDPGEEDGVNEECGIERIDLANRWLALEDNGNISTAGHGEWYRDAYLNFEKFGVEPNRQRHQIWHGWIPFHPRLQEVYANNQTEFPLPGYNQGNRNESNHGVKLYPVDNWGPYSQNDWNLGSPPDRALNPSTESLYARAVEVKLFARGTGGIKTSFGAGQPPNPNCPLTTDNATQRQYRSFCKLLGAINRPDIREDYCQGRRENSCNYEGFGCFGARRSRGAYDHSGADVVIPADTCVETNPDTCQKVRAFSDGLIRYDERGPWVYGDDERETAERCDEVTTGCYVIIEHIPDVLYTKHLHLQHNPFLPNDPDSSGAPPLVIQKWQVIGDADSSGQQFSDDPNIPAHLHYEVRNRPFKPPSCRPDDSKCRQQAQEYQVYDPELYGVHFQNNPLEAPESPEGMANCNTCILETYVENDKGEWWPQCQ